MCINKDEMPERQSIVLARKRFVQNVDVAASNSKYELEFITEDVDDEEEMQEASESVEIQEVVEVVHKTNISGSTSPNISGRVRKLFPSMGQFSGKIYGISQDDDGNIYEILFEDGNN